MGIASTSTWQQYVGQVIYLMHRDVKAVKSGEELTPSQYMEGLEALNALSRQWQHSGLVSLWTVEEVIVAMVAAQASYNMAADTLSIERAWIRNNGTDYANLVMMSREDYSDIPNKALQGIPTSLWYNNLLSGTTGSDADVLYPYPVPDLAYSMHIQRIRRGKDFKFLSDTPDFDAGWNWALRCNGAYAIAPANLPDGPEGIALYDRLKGRAEDSLRMAHRGEQETTSGRFAKSAY
jgi:hypothetical protein